MSWINLQLEGRSGGDAEKFTYNSKTSVSFSIAVGKDDNTQWWKCYVSEKSEFFTMAEHIKKGNNIKAEGIPSFKLYKKRDENMGIGLNLTVFKLEVEEIRGSGRPETKEDGV